MTSFFYRAFFIPWLLTLLFVTGLTAGGILLLRFQADRQLDILRREAANVTAIVNREITATRDEVRGETDEQRHNRHYARFAVIFRQYHFGERGVVLLAHATTSPLFLGAAITVSRPSAPSNGQVFVHHNSFDNKTYLCCAKAALDGWRVAVFSPEDEFFHQRDRGIALLELFAGGFILLLSIVMIQSARVIRLDFDRWGSIARKASLGDDFCATPDFATREFRRLYDSLLPILSRQKENSRRQSAENESQDRDRKLESIGVLAGGLAHDFNNLLTAIRGNIQLAMLFNRGRECERYLGDCDIAIASAMLLTRRLLTFSRGGAPVKVSMRLPGFLRQTVTFFLRGTGTCAKFDFPAELPLVEIDPEQIGQALHNLVINANQAMNNSGTIFISASLRTVSASETSVPPGRYVALVIRDNGPGFSPGVADKIFDPFFTTKPGGTGLGLSMCHTIVRRHGGAISAANAPEGGAMFTLLLPVLSVAAPAEEVSFTLPTPSISYAGGGRVLLMDDQSAIRVMLARMLELMNCQVDFAENGEEVIRKYRQSMEDGHPYDILFLDLSIPSGMGGRDTMTALLQIDPKVRAVVASGYSDDPVMADFRAFGFSARLQKPFRITDIDQIMNSFFGSKE